MSVEDPLPRLLDRTEELLDTVETFEPRVREQVLELLDAVGELHRHAVEQIARELGERLAPLRVTEPAVDWLFTAYGVGVDDVDAAVRALDDIRPYIEQHGGDVQVLAVHSGRVTVRLGGACSGCTASSETLREGVERALRAGLPGFVAMDVVQADPGAHPHAPPGPTLLQIQPRPE